MSYEDSTKSQEHREQEMLQRRLDRMTTICKWLATILVTLAVIDVVATIADRQAAKIYREADKRVQREADDAWWKQDLIDRNMAEYDRKTGVWKLRDAADIAGDFGWYTSPETK